MRVFGACNHGTMCVFCYTLVLCKGFLKSALKAQKASKKAKGAESGDENEEEDGEGGSAIEKVFAKLLKSNIVKVGRKHLLSFRMVEQVATRLCMLT